MKGLVDISGEWLGQPFLCVDRVTKYSKFYSVHWGDGTLTHYDYFYCALDIPAMCDEIEPIFEEGAIKTKPSKRRLRVRNRGSFSHGSVHGSATYLTKEAANQIAKVVEKHFRDALNLMVEAGVTTASLGNGFEMRDAVFRAFMAKRGAETV